MSKVFLLLFVHKKKASPSLICSLPLSPNQTGDAVPIVSTKAHRGLGDGGGRGVFDSVGAITLRNWPPGVAPISVIAFDKGSVRRFALRRKMLRGQVPTLRQCTDHLRFC